MINPELNSISIDSISVDTDGLVSVVFEFNVDQTTQAYETNLTARRDFDLEEYPILADLFRRVYKEIRKLMTTTKATGILAADCYQCSEARCCRDYKVYVGKNDVTHMMKSFPSMKRREFMRRFTVGTFDWTGEFKHQMKMSKDKYGERCVFLRPRAGKKTGYYCCVYENRPWVCREFRMDKCDDYTARRVAGREEDAQ